MAQRRVPQQSSSGVYRRDPMEQHNAVFGGMQLLMNVANLPTDPTNAAQTAAFYTAFFAPGEGWTVPYSSSQYLSSGDTTTLQVSVPSSRWVDFIDVAKGATSMSMILRTITISGSSFQVNNKVNDYNGLGHSTFDLMTYGPTVTARVEANFTTFGPQPVGMGPVYASTWVGTDRYLLETGFTSVQAKRAFGGEWA